MKRFAYAPINARQPVYDLADPLSHLRLHLRLDRGLPTLRESLQVQQANKGRHFDPIDDHDAATCLNDYNFHQLAEQGLLWRLPYRLLTSLATAHRDHDYLQFPCVPYAFDLLQDEDGHLGDAIVEGALG